MVGQGLERPENSLDDVKGGATGIRIRGGTKCECGEGAGPGEIREKVGSGVTVPRVTEEVTGVRVGSETPQAAVRGRSLEFSYYGGGPAVTGGRGAWSI